MKQFFSLILFIITPVLLLAQSNYKPGYVVYLKGDTIKGFIDYKEWNINPREIHFKSDLSKSTYDEYNLKNTKSFAITGIEFYERFILPISQDQVDINKLAVSPDTTTVRDTVFLKLSASGRFIKMFKYIDEIKPRYFILENGENLPAELIYHAYYNPSQSSTINYINTFRGQLTYLAQKNNVAAGNLKSVISRANYNESSIVKIVQLINGNNGEEFNPPGLIGSKWFIGAGINYHSLKFTQNTGTAFAGSFVTNNSGLFPEINAGIDVFTNKNTQKLVIAFELSATVNQFNVVNTNNPGIVQSTTTLKFSQYNTALSPQINYNFYNTEQFKVFAGIGLALNFSFYNQYSYITSYNNGSPSTEQKNYPSLQAFWLSFPLRAGVAINNKTVIYIKYFPAASITSDNVAMSGNVSGIAAGINFILGK